MIKQLEKIGKFSEDELKMIQQSLIKTTFKKGERVLELDQICQSLYLLERGAFYQFQVNEVGDQNIVDLYTSSEWVFNAKSLVWQQGSKTCIKAFTESTIWQLSLAKIHELIYASPSFFQLGKLLENKTFRHEVLEQKFNPLEKYTYLLHHKPAYVQTFPLKMIASYLQMAPETLSRVREKMMKRGGRMDGIQFALGFGLIVFLLF